MYEEIGYIINIVCKELHIENYGEIIRKVKEMKEALKRVKKEK